MAYRQLAKRSFVFLQESRPDEEFLSQSSEISPAPFRRQATHTVGSSG